MSTQPSTSRNHVPFSRLLGVVAASVFILCGAVASQGVAASSATKVHFCHSTTNLLPGATINACEDITDPGCTGGTPSAQAYIREKEAKGEPVSMLFLIDTYTAFPQMHGLQWDVNKLFIERYNWGFWSGEISIFSDTHEFGTLRDRNLPGIATNAKLEPASQWNDFATTQHVDPRTGIGMVTLFNIKSPLAYEWVPAVVRAIKNIKRNPKFKYLVVYCYNSHIQYTGAAEHNPSDKTYGLVQELQQVSPIPINGVMNVAINEQQRSFSFNGTFVVTESGTPGLGGKIAENLVCISFENKTKDETTSIVTNRSSHNLANLPAALKNDAYFDDLKFARSAARSATVNDPTVGYTEAMPEAMNGLYRPCMGGSCAMGSLFTDAYMWKLDVDIAFQNSAGLRGPGWPAGGVNVSYTWASMPWPNTLGVATLTGLSVWKMLNHSYSVPISTTYYAQGEFYLQTSGLRVRYNMDLEPTKLVSVDVRNRTTGAWEPLDRLKLYRVTIPNYEHFYMEPYSTILQTAQYEGEIAGVNNPSLLIQAVVQDYLKATTTTTNRKEFSVTERAVLDATVTVPMLWEHTKESCGPNTYWKEAHGTCFACPDKHVQPQSGQLECVLPESDSDVANIAAPLIASVVTAVGICLVIAFAIVMRGGSRDVANAPKDGRMTILFTDIQDSTKLWSTVPTSMTSCLDKHHGIIRAAITKFKAYEVKTVGDSFMIAVASEDKAIHLAMEIQRNLYAQSWPECINKLYSGDNDDNVDDDPTELATPLPTLAFNGIRVRIGVASGEAQVVFDEMTKGYDYFGQMVNIASRMTAVAMGGQVCCTHTTFKRLDISLHTDVVCRSVGAYHLRGVHEPVEITEIEPRELSDIRAAFFRSAGSEAMQRRILGADAGILQPAAMGKSESPSIPLPHQILDTDVAHPDDSFESLLTRFDESDVEHVTHSNRIFHASMMKVVKKSDAADIRKILLRAWRIQDDASISAKLFFSDKDTAVSDLCRRVTLSSSKALRKAVQEAQESLSFGSQHTSNGTPTSVSSGEGHSGTGSGAVRAHAGSGGGSAVSDVQQLGISSSNGERLHSSDSMEELDTIVPM